MIQVGMYVKTQHGTGRVLQLTDYRKAQNAIGDLVTQPHGAVVIYPDKTGALYPFEMMTVVEPPEKPKEPIISEQPKSHESAEPVWRWCPCCWDRTDHKPSTGNVLVCSRCGNRVEKSAPDTSNRYIVPTEDDEKLTEMAGSQQVAAV